MEIFKSNKAVNTKVKILVEGKKNLLGYVLQKNLLIVIKY